MEEVEQLGECYKDFAHFMFSTMIEIENALPEEIARRNVDTIRDIVEFNSPFSYSICIVLHKYHFLAGICFDGQLNVAIYGFYYLTQLVCALEEVQNLT